jgi:hypothetical protein
MVSILTDHISALFRKITMAASNKDKLVKQLLDHLDCLMGSVVSSRLKCSKHCTCNKGKKHLKYFLSTKRNGKTWNQYIPPKAVAPARRMTRNYRNIQNILKKISQENFKQLKKQYLTRPPRARHT